MNSRIRRSFELVKQAREASLTADEIFESKPKITNECYWYIMGKYCEAEKHNRKIGQTINEVLEQLGQKFRYSAPALRRFVCYHKAIDCFQLIAPEVASDIISGKLKLSIENVRLLYRKSDSEFWRTVERISAGNEPITHIFPERATKPRNKQTLRPPKAPPNGSNKRNAKVLPKSVKDTPQYNPNAQVEALTYTVPSWVKAIERIFDSENLSKISETARGKLKNELLNLKISTEILIDSMMEVTK